MASWHSQTQKAGTSHSGLCYPQLWKDKLYTVAMTTAELSRNCSWKTTSCPVRRLQDFPLASPSGLNPHWELRPFYNPVCQTQKVAYVMLNDNPVYTVCSFDHDFILDVITLHSSKQFAEKRQITTDCDGARNKRSLVIQTRVNSLGRWSKSHIIVELIHYVLRSCCTPHLNPPEMSV